MYRKIERNCCQQSRTAQLAVLLHLPCVQDAALVAESRRILMNMLFSGAPTRTVFIPE